MSVVPENFSDECLGKFLPAKPPISPAPENFSPADDRFFSIRPVLLPPSPLPSPSVRLSASRIFSDLMTFSEAMEVVLRGRAIRRLEWPRQAVIVKLADEKLMIHFDNGFYHPLIISTADLQGRDWVRVLE